MDSEQRELLPMRLYPSFIRASLCLVSRESKDILYPHLILAGGGSFSRSSRDYSTDKVCYV